MTINEQALIEYLRDLIGSISITEILENQKLKDSIELLLPLFELKQS